METDQTDWLHDASQTNVKMEI